MRKLLAFLLFTFSSSFVIHCYAQIAINNTAATPDASAILDLKTGNTGVNKGFLPQAVALTASNSASPIASPATGLIVYNTSTAGTPPNNVVPGYYYWSGSYWWGLGAPTMASGNVNYVARFTPTGKVLGIGMIQDDGSAVGIDTTPVYPDMLYVKSTNGTGIYSNATGGIAVYGNAIGSGSGVVGATTYGYGVYGITTTHSGFFAGVYGEDDSLRGIGVEGSSGNSSGTGVYGSGYGNNGVGVFGQGGKYGGSFYSYAGQGVYTNSGNAAGDSSVGKTYGVYGLSSIKHGFGIYGINSANGGVGIEAIGDTALTAYGTRDGIKAYGGSYNGVEGYGANAGMYGSGGNFGGRFLSPTGQGVYSSSSAAAGDSSIGVTYGGFFKGTDGPGVYSKSTTQAGDSSIGKTFGVYGSGAIGGQFTGTAYGLIVSSGNVGIGCTTPFYTLDVNGNIRASGSVYYGGTACSNAGTAYTKPDYVFEPDYKKTYSPFEIEKFIIANGHLPWVTSASDEKKENNGAVDITRMSFQTLEATENIQMEVIEQQKTIVSQQAEIDKLNKQLADLTNNVNQLLAKQK